MPTPRQNAGQPSRKQRRASKSAAGKQRDAGRRVIETGDLPDLQKARALWQQKRYPAALDLFKQAVRQHPRNLLALTDAARAFGARYELDQAEAYLARLVEMAPQDAGVQCMAGQSYRMIYRPDRAVACLERAVELDPQLPEARLELALLLERRGKLDEAGEHVRALATIPDCPPEVRVIEGRLARRKKDAESARVLLSGVLGDGNAFWQTRQHAGMELARTLDGQGDYAAAAAAARQAKAIATKHTDSAISSGDRFIREQWEIASHATTRQQLDRWADELADAPPRRLALLTGPPRSGTTLLENVLDAHPGLVSSDERDAFPRFITGSIMRDGRDDDTALNILDRQTRASIVDQRQRYFGFMQAALGEPIGDRLHLDKNPSISTLVPGVLRLFPECKIILALRDPRDVVVSCYFTHMPLNSQSAPYLEFGTAAQHYVNTMRAWIALREQLRPDQYLEVRYEDVVADTERAARRALDFLGLPWNASVLGFHERVAEKQVDSPTYEQVAQPIYTSSIGRWKHYESCMGDALETLSPMIDALGYK